jgi:inorganic pyrophosphatase
VDFESTASAIPPLGPRGNFSPDAVRRNGGAALTSRLGFDSSTRTSRVALPSRLHLHPWHDIPTGPEPPHQVTAVIEIPTNERNKYELDKSLGVFRLDRVLHSAVHYPGDYGFLPRTLADDGDPLDILVLMTIPVFTGCLVDARPIGLFHLLDRGVPDEKVLAVPMGDPYSEGLEDLADVPKHSLKEIEHFFQVYKDLEGTRTESRGFENAEAARKAIDTAMRMYQERFGVEKPGRV